MPIALSERDPTVAPEQVLAALVPPPTFADVSLESYRPDPAEPSQAAAVARVRSFATASPSHGPRRRRWLGRGRARSTARPASSAPSSSASAASASAASASASSASAASAAGRGLYLDGGFGVGKTHLLASLWREVEGPKLFATFVELTHLVGALGFADAVERLSAYRVVCIDEFELDDPGDTVLVSTLLTRLSEAGVMLAATSNTLPDRLGEGRFAAEDFLREIQALSARFEVVRIDGPDYRHRELDTPAVPYDDQTLRALAEATPEAAYDHWVDLTRHLADVHPSRYGALVAGVSLACLEDVGVFADQSTALRFVVLVDRLYDRGVPVAGSGLPLDQVFPPDMLAGGFRKKYFRALSRLVTLSHLP